MIQTGSLRPNFPHSPELGKKSRRKAQVSSPGVALAVPADE